MEEESSGQSRDVVQASERKYSSRNMAVLRAPSHSPEELGMTTGEFGSHWAQGKISRENNAQEGATC